MSTVQPGGGGRRLSRDEQLLWEQIARSVRPLRSRRPSAAPASAPEPVAAEPPSPLRTPPASRALRPATAPPPPPPPSPPPALVHGDTTAMDRRTADRFRRGTMGIDVRLDLHGMSQERAHQALRAAVERAWTNGQRTLLVITGKGMKTGGSGILRNAVPRWLNDADLRGRILSFAHAQPRDGGEGALYVLLRRRRD
ncbi:MAG: Smr/MutS family protein [Alphaproteobacteria bacterium]